MHVYNELESNVYCLYFFLRYGREDTMQKICNKFNLTNDINSDDLPLLIYMLRTELIKNKNDKENRKEEGTNKEEENNENIIDSPRIIKFFELFIPSLNIIDKSLVIQAINNSGNKQKNARRRIARLISDILDYILKKEAFVIFKTSTQYGIPFDTETIEVVSFSKLGRIKTKQYYVSHFDNIGLQVTDEKGKINERLKHITDYDQLFPMKTIARYKLVHKSIMRAVGEVAHCPLCNTATNSKRCCKNCNNILLQFATARMYKDKAEDKIKVKKNGNKTISEYRKMYYDRLKHYEEPNNWKETIKLRREELYKILNEFTNHNNDVHFRDKLQKLIQKSFP